MYNKYAKIRDERGYTDYYVAKETGIATATMTDWKMGRYVPKVDKLMKIARLLEVPLEDLLSDEVLS